MMPKSFGDYGDDKSRWLTSLAGEFYPDYLASAAQLYKPVIERFGQLLQAAGTSEQMFRLICDEPGPSRVQLCRVFRKYVAPGTSVELLKRKSDVEVICRNWGSSFRPLADVRKAFATRPIGDDALAALLWEYKDRGAKGYELTGSFFDWFETRFASKYSIEGPRGAGRDIDFASIFPGFSGKRPVDFVIRRKRDNRPLVIGLARYDSDRGGAQEDDRTGGYQAAIDDVMTFSSKQGHGLKMLFINDGPGLALGSMWDDYATLERRVPRVLVSTLKMLDERVTEAWLES